jgi:hypothetical protein
MGPDVQRAPYDDYLLFEVATAGKVKPLTLTDLSGPGAVATHSARRARLQIVKALRTEDVWLDN